MYSAVPHAQYQLIVSVPMMLQGDVGLGMVLGVEAIYRGRLLASRYGGTYGILRTEYSTEYI